MAFNTGVTVIKVIKPRRFKDKEFNRVLRNEMRKAARVIKKDFEATTRTWKRKPKFVMHTKLRQDEPSPSVRVDTDNLIYFFLNDGTKKHDIWAGIYTGKSDKKVLAFPSIFSPKTFPGFVGSVAGVSGGPTVFTPYVIEHPGTKARKWDEAIKKEREPWFKDRMEEAMLIARDRSGHALG